MSVKNPDLIPLFNKIKTLIKPYEKYFTVADGEGAYSLVHKGEIYIGKYTRDEVYFVGILIQKHYVGFYFMPQYSTEHKPDYFSGEDLLKLLKGKSCYYIVENKFTSEVQDQLKEALKKGFECYKKKGWVK